MVNRKFYLDLVIEKPPYNDAMQKYFMWMGLGFAKTILSKSGFEMLKNEGFNIIESKSLKKEILDLYEVTFPRLESSENNRTLDLLEEEVLLYQRRNFTWNDNGRIPLDYDALLNDHYFIEIVRTSWGRESVLINRKKQTLEENNRVLQRINDELKIK